MAKLKLPSLPSLFGRKEKQIDTDNTATISASRMQSMFSTGPEHAVQKLLDECGIGGGVPMPRDWMPFSRILYSKLSLYTEAIDKTADFAGKVQIDPEADVSDQTRKMVNAFWDSIGLLGEFESVPNMRGVDSLVNQMIKIALRDGMAFCEDRFRLDEDEVTDEYVGQMVFDSSNFDYVAIGRRSVLLLQYLDSQFPQADPNTGDSIENQFFHVLKLEGDARSPWGLPLAAGNELLAKVVISMLISIELQSKRFGNPPTFTAITPKDLTKIGTNQFKINGKIISPQEALLMASENFRDSIEEALVLSHKGKAAEVVQGFPAPVDIVSRILGEGMTNMVDSDLLWKLCVILINGFGIPPALMNINVSSGGMNSDMFATSIQVFKARVEKVRNFVAPIVKQITVNHLINEGVNPAEAQKIKIGFIDVDIQSPEQKTQIEKTEAETKKIQFEVYEGLSNYNPTAAENYAAKVGLF